jgi:nucleoside-diphosphate-sugar epimerase
MNILLTGAAGFIGSHLSEKLLNLGHQVIGVDNFDTFYNRNIKEDNLKIALQNPLYSFHELDITNAYYYDKWPVKIDVVVHLAAKAGVRPSIENPEAYLKTNILGTLNVLEYMRKIGCPNLVFASSSSVYGNNTKIPFEESDTTDQPISPYAASKKSCELLIYNYHTLYKFNCINLRFFTVYGPRQRPDLAIHKFVNKIRNNEPIEVYGKGETARDYTFIDDTIKGIVESINYIQTNRSVFETINLGNNSPIKLRDLIQKIENNLEIKAKINFKPMQDGDVDITFSSIEKAKQLLKYNPETSIDEGLEKFIAWYKNKNSNT